jgi:hypothetical protein
MVMIAWRQVINEIKVFKYLQVHKAGIYISYRDEIELRRNR